VHAHPLLLYLPSRKLQCTIQLREQIHSLYFISTTMYSVLPPNKGPSEEFIDPSLDTFYGHIMKFDFLVMTEKPF
jgi:hypothetical protein